MEKSKIFSAKRKAKQYGMSLVFIIIVSLGWQYPLLGYFIPLCMILGLALGLRRGRKWCDWYCPRGSFYDSAVAAISAKKNIPPLAKNLYFRFGVLVALMSLMAVNIIFRWPDFNRVGLFLIILLTATTSLGVILALIFHQRTWCTVCPIGTIINVIGKNKYPLKINSELCVECKLCAKACPVQIKPYLYKDRGIRVVRDGDCLKCGSCVAVCPRKALSF